jgi:hypothetical protein
MFSTRAKYLIFILVLLQFVAPLVHAHTSAEPHGKGIHLPEFRYYSADIDSAFFHAMEHPCVDECSIISIGAGIKHKKVSTNNSDVFYFSAEIFSFKTNTDCFSGYPLTYQQQTLISLARYFLLPSRAPPSQ